MAKTADLKLRIDPDLKKAVTEVYAQWGLNLTDVVTVFLHQSVAVGGLPFAMEKPAKAPSFNWKSDSLVRIDPTAGHALLPEEWDAAEDSVYDNL